MGQAEPTATKCLCYCHRNMLNRSNDIDSHRLNHRYYDKRSKASSGRPRMHIQQSYLEMDRQTDPQGK